MAVNFLVKYKFKNLLYFIIIFCGVLCNAVAFTIDIILYGFYDFMFFFIAMASIFLLLGIFGYISGKTEGTIMALLGLLDFIEAPLIIYIYGINATPYLMLIIVLNTEVLKGKIRAVIIPLMFSIIIASVILGYYYPQKLVDFGSSRYIPGMISFIFVAAVLILISLGIISKYNHQVQKNVELNDKLLASSQRDLVTRTFTKAYANECLEYLLDTVDKFTIGIYKITSYDKIYSKYGKQFADVATTMLADVLINNAAPSAIIARYSSSTFIAIFNEYDTENVKNILFKNNEEIQNAISKIFDVSIYTEKAQKGENLNSLINRLAIRINGFGE